MRFEYASWDITYLLVYMLPLAPVVLGVLFLLLAFLVFDRFEIGFVLLKAGGRLLFFLPPFVFYHAFMIVKSAIYFDKVDELLSDMETSKHRQIGIFYDPEASTYFHPTPLVLEDVAAYGLQSPVILWSLVGYAFGISISLYIFSFFTDSR